MTLFLSACAFQTPTNFQAYPLDREGAIELPAPKGNHTQPLVVILALNEGTETTDFMVPYGVLKESGVARVVTVSTRPGPVNLHPALRVRVDKTIASFDEAYPEGADIVIVPALHNARDSATAKWLREQAATGALMVGICDGAKTLVHAGLLDNRIATSHWFSLYRLTRTAPHTTWIHNRRYVVDGPVMTTAGITASIPASLALVEAIAGLEVATATADRLGMPIHSTSHDGTAFGFTRQHLALAGINRAMFWRNDIVELAVEDEVDEIALALTADAWSRTYRSLARSVREQEGAVRSLRGLVIEVDAKPHTDRQPMPLTPPWDALDQSLDAIAVRYGRRTAEFVALQLEYVW